MIVQIFNNNIKIHEEYGLFSPETAGVESNVCTHGRARPKNKDKLFCFLQSASDVLDAFRGQKSLFLRNMGI